MDFKGKINFIWSRTLIHKWLSANSVETQSIFMCCFAFQQVSPLPRGILFFLKKWLLGLDYLGNSRKMDSTSLDHLPSCAPKLMTLLPVPWAASQSGFVLYRCCLCWCPQDSCMTWVPWVHQTILGTQSSQACKISADLLISQYFLKLWRWMMPKRTRKMIPITYCMLTKAYLHSKHLTSFNFIHIYKKFTRCVVLLFYK
jgi:hypothetical protein